jgi:hypothetical protein
MAFSDAQEFACLPREISEPTERPKNEVLSLHVFTDRCLHEEPALAATALRHRWDHNAALVELRGH